MTVLVTGATGLVGNNTVRQLLAKGQAVRAMVRGSGIPRSLEGLDVEIAYGDIRNEKEVQHAMQGVRAVVHAAGKVKIGWTGLEEARAINLHGTQHVAKAALENGAKMLHVSSIDALGMGDGKTPIDENSPYELRLPCPYAITKHEADIAVEKFVEQGLHAVTVFPGFMLGPWDWKPSSGRLLLENARFKLWFAPRGGNDFTSVVDVVAAMLNALETGTTGARYLLSGTSHTYREAATIFAEVCGYKPPFFTLGPMAYNIGGWYGDLRTKITGRESDVNSALIRLTKHHHFFSHEKAARELGYNPKNLRDAATEAWAWFGEYGFR